MAGDRRTRWYASYSQSAPLLAAAAIAVGFVGAWTGSILLGGSHSAAPHLFYVPIVLAAVRFSWPGAAAAALGAGVLAGPMLPAEVSSGTEQPPSAWLLRLAIFLIVGVFIAVLVEGPGDAISSRLLDAGASARLLRALDKGAIEVFYQPIYRLLDDQLVAVEALVRWRKSPDRYVKPDTFIPAAERTGVITRIDEYVLDQAVTAARGWATAAGPVSISVNFSAAMMAQPQLVQTVQRVLDTREFRPQRLQVEITESALIDDLPTAVRQVEALRAMGVKVAIDDFGSGHASLNYLRHFPADVVKLDRSLITAAAVDDRCRVLLEGVVNLCAHLGLRVIAEGVEFSDQLSLVREVGVPMAQGFLLGMPSPIDEIRSHLGTTR